MGNSGVRSLRMLPGGDRALVANVNGQLGVYDLKKKAWVYEVQVGHTQTILGCSIECVLLLTINVFSRVQVGHTQTIFGCSFSPTHKDLLATCSYDGSVKFWDVSTLKLMSSVDLGAGLGSKGAGCKGAEACCCYDLSWAPNGERCVVASSDGIYIHTHTYIYYVYIYLYVCIYMLCIYMFI